jgi:hypothetical protein
VSLPNRQRGAREEHRKPGRSAKPERWQVKEGQLEETGEVGKGTAEYSVMPVWPQWLV